jgi:hypothetical protein
MRRVILRSGDVHRVSGCGVVDPLSPTGCYCKACLRGEPCAVDPTQVDTCTRWLALYAEPSMRVGRVQERRSSYGLKHAVESWTAEHGARQYIANGAFIVAALNSGIEAVVTGINCEFRMRARRS